MTSVFGVQCGKMNRESPSKLAQDRPALPIQGQQSIHPMQIHSTLPCNPKAAKKQPSKEAWLYSNTSILIDRGIQIPILSMYLKYLAFKAIKTYKNLITIHS